LSKGKQSKNISLLKNTLFAALRKVLMQVKIKSVKARLPLSKIKSKNMETTWKVDTMQIKGQSKPVVLKAEYAGIAVDPYGQTKAGMTISGSIKRSDFGLTWSAVTEAGHVVVGDEIKLAAELQLIKQ